MKNYDAWLLENKILNDEYFINEAETYSDYPSAAVNNAKKALKWKKEHGDEVKAGTEVGWKRANQLANKEKLSRDVVSRMAQFNRHRKNSKIDPKYKDEPWKDRGYVAWLLWGGDAGVDWAINKMAEINENIILNDKLLNEASRAEKNFIKQEIQFRNEIKRQLNDPGVESIIKPKLRELLQQSNDIINDHNLRVKIDKQLRMFKIQRKLGILNIVEKIKLYSDLLTPLLIPLGLTAIIALSNARKNYIKRKRMEKLLNDIQDPDEKEKLYNEYKKLTKDELKALQKLKKEV